MVVHRVCSAFSRNSPRMVRPGDVPYAIDPGMPNSLSVPPPVPVQTSSFPPMRRARSRIPGKPDWPARPSSTIAGSMPIPSSRMRNWNELPLYVMSASILRASAWRKALRSRTPRNVAGVYRRPDDFAESLDRCELLGSRSRRSIDLGDVPTRRSRPGKDVSCLYSPEASDIGPAV
jgi:hypothetical protein